MLGERMVRMDTLVGGVPSLCLSGKGGTTQAGKSFARCERKKTKSVKRLRADGVGVEKMGRLVLYLMSY